MWSAYYQKLKILKEEQLRKLLNEKAKQLNELAGAATVLQKHWRRCKCVYFYCLYDIYSVFTFIIKVRLNYTFKSVK